MRKGTFWLLCTVISFFTLLTQSGMAQQANEESEELIRQISEMTERYKKYRLKTSDIFKRYGEDSDQMIENEQLIVESDAKNTAQAKAIFQEFGLPAKSRVGADKAHEFWVIVQHCNNVPDFQLSVLKAMDKALENGEADHRDYAYLTDRVLINIGRPQIYGTQIRYNENTRAYEPYEVQNTETVDRQRKKMGLEPIDNYIRTMNIKYEGTLKRNKKSIRLKKKR